MLIQEKKTLKLACQPVKSITTLLSASNFSHHKLSSQDIIINKYKMFENMQGAAHQKVIMLTHLSINILKLYTEFSPE